MFGVISGRLERLHQVRFVALWKRVVKRYQPPLAASAYGINGFIRGDATDPGGERAAIPGGGPRELAHAVVGLQKGFLANILGVREVSCNPEGRAKNGRLRRAYKYEEGSRRASAARRCANPSVLLRSRRCGHCAHWTWPGKRRQVSNSRTSLSH